jgi:hypothetical protein
MWMECGWNVDGMWIEWKMACDMRSLRYVMVAKTVLRINVDGKKGAADDKYDQSSAITLHSTSCNPTHCRMRVGPASSTPAAVTDKPTAATTEI